MKVMKKVAMLLLAVCLVIPSVSMISHAASGKIQFTDPSTKTGETVEVTCAIKSDNGAAVGDVTVGIKYDTTMLAFKKGQGVTESSMGNLTYSGTGNAAALRFTMEFSVIKEGTTKLEVASYEAKLASGEALECQKGTSTITIAKGTNPVQTPATTPATDGVKVTVNGVEYTLTEVPDAEVPEGFEKTNVEYEGTTQVFAKQDASGMYLAFLSDAEGNGDLFIYDLANGTFAPFELIEVSTTTSIVLLSDASAITLPAEYQEVSITVNEFEFPAWTYQGDTTGYILYAINNKGQASLYKYDVEEGTYQRIETPEVVEEEVDNSTLGKVQAYVNEYFSYVVLVVGLVLVFFLVLMIVLGVKLHNRNLELDDLYDEYGIDLEDEEPKKEPKEKKYDDIEEIDFGDDVEDDDEDEQDDEEDKGIELDDLRYEEDEDDFDLKFQTELKEKLEEDEPEKPSSKTMKKEDSFFEDFDFDLIDLDD